MKDLTHLDKDNNPSMVDVSSKSISKRTATAKAEVIFPDSIQSYFSDGDLVTKKGVSSCQQLLGERKYPDRTRLGSKN